MVDLDYFFHGLDCGFGFTSDPLVAPNRSEERRVGKEC